MFYLVLFRIKIWTVNKYFTKLRIRTVNTDFSYVEVWFTDQTSKALEIEDSVDLTLIIG